MCGLQTKLKGRPFFRSFPFGESVYSKHHLLILFIYHPVNLSSHGSHLTISTGESTRDYQNSKVSSDQYNQTNHNCQPFAHQSYPRFGLLTLPLQYYYFDKQHKSCLSKS
ncbi:hypothetical protein EYC84_007119 [Monilinia fructicola]|uniref:Uncharacterized protein n=1 Tax=Monilinia fructicola TaxID=38448 RepID=A0A5M9K5L3_MONFR|nr:hypothetical protein EYC84_007119 [Monilinia fructicola]